MELQSVSLSVSQSVSQPSCASQEQNSYSERRAEKRWKNDENEVQSLNNLVFQFRLWMADIAIDFKKLALILRWNFQ